MTPRRRATAWAAAGLGTLGLAACVTAPPGHRDAAFEAPAPLPPPPSTQVLFYPAAGQSAEQQDRDRYECYRWATRQSGFDPAQPHVAPHQRVAIVPVAPPGAGAVSGALTGAFVGAAVSNPRSAGGDALIGAIAGAMLGAASDASRQERAGQIQQRLDQSDARAAAQGEQQADSFRRAMSACLEGRGYTVK